jgi:heme A synthase
MNAFRVSARVAFLLTFLLIGLGGIVHNTGSSLACPDWPLCFGQVMPVMEGGVAIEHSHRLLASLVGFICIALVVQAFRLRKQDPLLLRGAIFALLLVIFQGVLGGVTVLMRLSPYVSTAHLATSQLFVAVLLWLNLRATPWEKLYGQTAALREAVPAKARKGVLIAAIAVYVQMLLGASIRHGGAGIACGLGSEAMFLCVDVVTATRTLWPSIPQAQLHMIHRFGGILAGAAVIAGTMPLLKWAKREGIKRVRLLCVAGHAIWTFQMILGILTIRNYIGVVSVTLHLVFAVLLWIVVLNLLFLSRMGERPTLRARG